MKFKPGSSKKKKIGSREQRDPSLQNFIHVPASTAYKIDIKTKNAAKFMITCNIKKKMGCIARKFA